jgi:NADH-quinone oxidoreductase E subunit
MKTESPPDLKEILARYPGAERDSLIPLLQEVQESEGYLSREAVTAVGSHLKLPAAKVYGVATFYNQFRFSPRGRYHIQVCRGTACHVKGSGPLLGRLERELKIEPGQTTRDGLFSLEIVACIGACGLAPVISVNGEYHAHLGGDDIPGLLANYRKREEETDD